MQHALSCFVEHDRIISSPQRDILPLQSISSRLILGSRKSKTPPALPWIYGTDGYVDGGAIGQRHHGADTGGRHQAPAHRIIPNNGQQAAVQDDELLAKYPPDAVQPSREGSRPAP